MEYDAKYEYEILVISVLHQIWIWNQFYTTDFSPPTEFLPQRWKENTHWLKYQFISKPTK